MFEFIIALFYVLRQAAAYVINIGTVSWGGNLDPVYLLAPLYLWTIRKDLKKLKVWGFLVLVFIGYGFIQSLVNPNLDVFKWIVNVTKILICLMAMMFTKEHTHRFKLHRWMSWTLILMTGFGILALFYSESMLWILDDKNNPISPNRLRMLYMEPSEMGFHLMLILIALTALVLRPISFRLRCLLIGFGVIVLGLLAIALPFGTIMIGALSMGLLILIDGWFYPSKGKQRLIWGLVMVGGMGVGALILTNSPLYLRVLSVISGQDASIGYRVGVTSTITRLAFVDFVGLGAGFGNVNTPVFVAMYRQYGFAYVMATSFFYFLVEGGIFAIVFLGFLLYGLFKATQRSRSTLKWGLLIFVVIYQFFGSHFTSGLTWVVYGILLSPLNENRVVNAMTADTEWFAWMSAFGRSLRKRPLDALLLALSLALVAVSQVYNDLLPQSYELWIMVVGLILALVAILRSKRLTILGLSFMLVAVSGILGYSQWAFDRVLTPTTTETGTYAFLVLNDSPLQNLNQEANLVVGISELMAEEAVDAVREHVETTMTTPDVQLAASDEENAALLLSGEIDIMVLDTSMNDLLLEVLPDFFTQTRVIITIEKEYLIEQPTEPTDTSQDAFVVLISGLDSIGKLAARGRSDVNILLVVNPKTRTVLTVSIPRDTYTPLGCRTGAYDKLTHAGVYGVDCSIKTIEQLMDINIQYYIKLNFTSFLTVVKAIGPIQVYSQTTFTTTKWTDPNKFYTFKSGS
jgi:LCP family protein required for cell wall assembly